MSSLRNVLPLALAALSLGLSGCDQKLRTEDPTSSLAQEGAGGLAFRIAAADLAAFPVVVDSVRVEAERAGFPLHAAVGGLGELVELSDLASGDWTVKVAFYDASQQIQLYGEAVVRILPGRTVDAVVHLRRATGSVRVRIVLDDADRSNGVDTLLLDWGENTPSWKPVKAWRTADGIYLVSGLQEPCITPYVTFVDRSYGLNSRGSALARSALILYIPPYLVLGTKTDSGRVCATDYRERTKFIPWTATGPVTLYTPGDSIVLAGPPVDTAHRRLEVGLDTALNHLPILSSYRSDSGIHILAVVTSQVPLIGLVPGATNVLKFGASRSLTVPSIREATHYLPPPEVTAWYFVRWNPCSPVTLLDASGGQTFFPAKGCVQPPQVDTVPVAPIPAPANYDQMEKLPVLGAWRDARGVYIATRYDCNAPPQVVETDMFTMNSGLVQFTPVRPGLRTMIACGEARHVLFVPTKYNGPHRVYDPSSGSYFELPGIVVPASDSSASMYRLNILRADSAEVVYELTMDGTLRRTTTYPLQIQILPAPVVVEAATEPATGPDTSMVIVRLPPPQFTSSTHQETIVIGSILRDSIQRILDLPAMRLLPQGLCQVESPKPTTDWVAAAPAMIRAIPGPYDLPVLNSLFYSRQIRFADGRMVDWDLGFRQICPDGGGVDRLALVDRILVDRLPLYEDNN